MLLAFACLFLIGSVGVAWPFLFYPLILRALPKLPAQREAVTPLSASLLFCAFNEARAMPDKLDNLALLKRQNPNLELLAFDDGSSDGTADLIAALEGVTLIRGAGRSGKAAGMKQLAAEAHGDILIFTDANVSLASDAVETLLSYYADAAVGGVLGSLRYKNAEGSATASVGSLYWRIEEKLKDFESATGNVMGADGSIFSIRRELYPQFPDDVLDDLTVSMAVIFAGKRLIKAADVNAFEALVAARGDEYRRKVRIAARAWRTHLYLRPQLRRMSALDQMKYVSRKIVRWFGGVFIIAAAVGGAGFVWIISPIAGAALLGLGFIFLLLGCVMRRGPIAAVVDILIAYAATLQGVLKAIRGERFTVWTPAKSR